MKQRLITAFILIAILRPILYLGGWPLKILMVVGGLMATYEITKLTEKKWPAYLRILSYAFMLLIMFINLLGVKYFFLVQCLILITLMSFIVFYEKVTFEDATLMFVLYTIFGMVAGSLFKMYEYSNMVIFYVLIATCVTDAGAYSVGRRIGKRKLNERISPNKTIEGAVGGYIIGAIVSFVFAYFVLCRTINMPVLLFVCGSILLPFVGQIGDLFYSAIKRHYGIKDFGTIFPGHGGVLDRLDSVSFNMILMYVLMLVIL